MSGAVPNTESGSDKVDSYNAPSADDDYDEIRSISRVASRTDAKDPNNVLNRLKKSVLKLSSLRSSDPFTIDPEDFDLNVLLKSFLHNADEAGVELRSTGLAFKNVTTIGVDESATFAPTFATAVNIPGAIIEGIKNRGVNPTRRIISNVTGYAKHGEMVLVIGRPGAGCSTFLKTISGEVSQYVGTEGEISFDGMSKEEMFKDFKSDVIYNPELDLHFPHLTVEQTLNFAIACKLPKVRVSAAAQDTSVEQYVKFKTEMLATIFGLRHTYQTKVGNEFIRGVSGGERKRVSIAEALAVDAKVYCWDNATRGLDASTALEYAQAIRVFTNLMKSTNFVTIYQASEHIYETFDKVLVLYEGKQIFFGPAENAKAYFETMGFQCPARQSTADFLTAVTDPVGRFPKDGYENKVPRTAGEFESYWLNSVEYTELTKEIASYEGSVEGEKSKELFLRSFASDKRKVKSKYTISFFSQLRLNYKRSFQITLGDPSYVITQLMADIIQGLIAGSLFWNSPEGTNGAFSKGGVLFFACLYYSLVGLATVPNAYSKRPILLKQKAYTFYHPSTEYLAANTVDFIFKIPGITSFAILLFFLSNLKRTAGHFFIFYLFINSIAFTMNNLFQMIAALNRHEALAHAFSGIIILASIMYSCFMIQLPSMHPWFKWINYLNPVRYAFEALLVAEFHGSKMACGTSLVPSGPGYEGVSEANQVCAFVGSKTGQTYVLGDDYFKIAFDYSYKHLWRNFGIVMGFMVFFTCCGALAAEYLTTDVAGFDVLIFKKNDDTKKLVEEARAHDDVEKNNDSSSVAANLSRHATENKVFQSLGSEDIFMWQHVNFDITLKDGTTRRLLNDIQGYVKPGTLTALVGESGAGKTTLLNTLSQRIDVGTITGDILVNGKDLSASFQRTTGYVQQQDVHIAELTVRESLRFAAQLRRPRSVPDSEKFEYVEEVMKILEMTHYADALVGNPGFGLNVEQRKKLSIGIELVAKPALLLFLDEPTSGLDSQSSWSIVKLLRRLSDGGQAILCTIHQPSAVLFEQFDRLLLLKKGGTTVYFGDIGKHSSTLVNYFETNGARKCLDSENPAEYILEIIGAGATAKVKENWGDVWLHSQEYKTTTEEVNKLIEDTRQSSKEATELEHADLSKVYITPYYYQLGLVIKRTALTFFRDPTYIMSKMTIMIFAGLFIGFTFWNVGDSVIGMQNAMFSIFLSIVLSAPLMNQIQARALDSREIFEVRESKSNTYHWSALLISQLVNELPYHLLFGTIFWIALYYPIHRDYSSAVAGQYYMFYVIFFQLYYISFALWVIYACPNVPTAAVLVSLSLALMISFCGVVQPPSLMPGFWTFMWKASPFTYFIQNFLILSLKAVEVKCKKNELAVFQPPSGETCMKFAEQYIAGKGGYLLNPNSTSNCAYCKYTDGLEYLKSLNISVSNEWRNFGFFWVYILFNVFCMLTFYYLFRVAKIDFDLTRFFKRTKKTSK